MRVHKILGAMLLAFVLIGCTACSTLQNVVTSTTSAPADQANQVAAVEKLYTAAGTGELLYLNSGHADPAVAKEIARLDNIAHDALVSARTAVANGNNALIAAALKIFSSNTDALRTFLISKGIPL